MALNAKQAVQELISYTIVTDKGSLVALLKRYGVKLSASPSDAEVTTATLVAMKKSKAFSKDLSKLLQSKLPKAGEAFKNIVGNDQDFGFTGVDDVTYERNVTFTGTDDFSDFTGWDDFQAADGTYKPYSSTKKPTSTEGLTVKKSTSVSISPDVLARAKASAGQASQLAAQQKPKKAGSETGKFWKFLTDKVLTQDNANAAIEFGINKINQDSLRKQNALEQQSLLLQQQQDQMRNKVGGGISGNTVLYVGVGIIALVGIGYLIMKQSKK